MNVERLYKAAQGNESLTEKGVSFMYAQEFRRAMRSQFVANEFKSRAVQQYLQHKLIAKVGSLGKISDSDEFLETCVDIANYAQLLSRSVAEKGL